jgi:hypothetical protein
MSYDDILNSRVASLSSGNGRAVWKNYDPSPETGSVSLKLVFNVQAKGGNDYRAAIFVRNPRFYFSTARFREIFPDSLCDGGPLHVARPVI